MEQVAYNYCFNCLCDLYNFMTKNNFEDFEFCINTFNTKFDIASRTLFIHLAKTVTLDREKDMTLVEIIVSREYDGYFKVLVIAFPEFLDIELLKKLEEKSARKLTIALNQADQNLLNEFKKSVVITKEYIKNIIKMNLTVLNMFNNFPKLRIMLNGCKDIDKVFLACLKENYDDCIYTILEEKLICPNFTIENKKYTNLLQAAIYYKDCYAVKHLIEAGAIVKLNDFNLLYSQIKIDDDVNIYDNIFQEMIKYFDKRLDRFYILKNLISNKKILYPKDILKSWLESERTKIIRMNNDLNYIEISSFDKIDFDKIDKPIEGWNEAVVFLTLDFLACQDDTKRFILLNKYYYKFVNKHNSIIKTIQFGNKEVFEKTIDSFESIDDLVYIKNLILNFDCVVNPEDLLTILDEKIISRQKATSDEEVLNKKIERFCEVVDDDINLISIYITEFNGGIEEFNTFIKYCILNNKYKILNELINRNFLQINKDLLRRFLCSGSLIDKYSIKLLRKFLNDTDENELIYLLNQEWVKEEFKKYIKYKHLEFCDKIDNLKCDLFKKIINCSSGNNLFVVAEIADFVKDDKVDQLRNIITFYENYDLFHSSAYDYMLDLSLLNKSYKCFEFLLNEINNLHIDKRTIDMFFQNINQFSKEDIKYFISKINNKDLLYKYFNTENLRPLTKLYGNADKENLFEYIRDMIYLRIKEI